MHNFNDLFRDFMKAGERIGKDMGKFEMKCPRCHGVMCMMKKYLSINIYFWICGCGVDFPVDR